MPRLSVSAVIPTYNRAHLVGRAILSALAALAPGDEVVVADDGSTDETEAAIAPYRDRIRYLKLPHRGAGATRNSGIEAAKGPLLAFLDSDDEWWPDKIALHRAFHEAREDVLFSFTDFGVKEEDGTEHRSFLHSWQDRPGDWNQMLGLPVPYSSVVALPAGRPDFGVRIGSMFLPELTENYVATFTLLVRKDLAGDALRYATDMPTCDDWECFGRLARRGTAAFFATETAWQHGHAGPRITRINTYVTAEARLKILARVWGADPDFLLAHGDAYSRVVAEQHVVRARWLLRKGRGREAREELRLAGGGPLSHRLLSWLPGPVTRGALRILRGPPDDRTLEQG